MKKAIAFFAALAFLTGCSGGKGTSDAARAASSANQKSHVTVGLTYIPDIQFAPFYVAQEKGYFRQEGLDITLRHHGAQEALLGALESGEEDVVFAGADEMLQGRSNGIDVVNWATMYQKYPVTLIVPESSQITNVADLRGKTLGLPGPYGANYFTLLAMLKAHGMSESELSVQYIGYTQAAALSTGKVDAILGYMNSDTVAIEASLGAPVRTIDPVSGGIPLVGVGLGSLSATLEKKKGHYEAILRALDRAVSFAVANPEETVKITQKYVPALVDPERERTARKVLERTLDLYGTEYIGAQDPERWAAMASFMERNGLLSKAVGADEAFRSLR